MGERDDYVAQAASGAQIERRDPRTERRIESLERADAAVRDWLEIEYPKIRARAKREKAEIC